MWVFFFLRKNQWSWVILLVNQGEDVDGTSEQASQLCPCSDLSASLWACFLEKDILGKLEELWSEDK